jgi:hypothetical protein
MGLPLWLANWYAPLDFSNVSVFPHKNPSIVARGIICFYGCDDSFIVHISYFIKYKLNIGII